MSLASIPNRKPQYRPQLVHTNKIDDIVGAKPRQRIRNIQKPDYHHCKDIAGTSPTRLVPKSVNKVSTLNMTSDIEGAQSSSHSFRTTRNVDPMNPTYKLPVAKPAPAAKVKFHGDRQMDIADIKGTSTTKPKGFLRHSNRTDDIEGASVGWRRRKINRRNPPRNPLAVDDIMVKNRTFARDSDPLNPVHYINGMTIQNEDPGIKPRPLPKQRSGPNLYGTQDIEGASTHLHAKKYQRRKVRDPNDISDIKGSGADSAVNGLRTKRVCNPNDPGYQSLCGTSLGSVQRPNTPDAQHSMFFKSLDLDGDGVVTYDELLQQADFNKDGNLSVAELHKFAKGKISDKDLRKLTEVRQAALDRNNRKAVLNSKPDFKRVSDPRDKEIDSLRAELQRLKNEAARYGPLTGRSTSSSVTRASAASSRRSRRQAQQRKADIASVRNLPDNPLRNAGSSLSR